MLEVKNDDIICNLGVNVAHSINYLGRNTVCQKIFENSQLKYSPWELYLIIFHFPILLLQHNSILSWYLSNYISSLKHGPHM